MSIRIGIMSFAHMHAHAYASAANELEEITLAGVADHDQERAASAAATYGTNAFPSYEALLASNIDAVVIGSENSRHLELTRMAAQAGKHVLCEKPIATNAEDGREMIRICQEAGVQLMTAFPCRFSPAVNRLKAAVESGEIGKVLAIRGTNRGRCPFGWFVEKELSGGGAVIDHTVHVADLIRWITGAEFTNVYAEISSGIHKQEWEDTGFLTMELSNGAFATLDCSWSRPNAFPTWGDVTMAFVGEKGTLTLDMFAQHLVHYRDGERSVNWLGWGDDIDLLMVKAFAKCISEGQTVPISGEDGLRAVEVALAAYQSVATGQPANVIHA
jgi:predicted dehydrogenase